MSRLVSDLLLLSRLDAGQVNGRVMSGLPSC